MSSRHAAAQPETTLRHRVESLALRSILALLSLVPYPLRVALGGRAMRLVAWRGASSRTMAGNLRLVYPDATDDWIRATARASADTMGRYVTELFAGDAFTRRAAQSPISGPGLAALAEARQAGRAVIFVSGHFGNYDAWRSVLRKQGMELGAFYIPVVNPDFNQHYVKRMSAISSPLFPRGNDGLADLVRFLRRGGALGILTDFPSPTGEALDFLGHPALTALSAAKLALKYDACILPIYATRQPDGLSFVVDVEAPIPHGDPLDMTRALNDSLSARVRANPQQWFWILKRWKFRPQP